jgi:hypothetical protein
VRLELRSVLAGAALALLLALPGCGSAKKEPTKGTAGGEVLEASVTDAMLPVDQVRSQPPLAPRTEGDGSKHGSQDGDAGEGGAASSDAAGTSAGDQGAPAAPAAATPSAE